MRTGLSLAERVLGIFILFAQALWAENLYVTPSGAGATSGADWNNAFAGFNDVAWGNGAGQLGAGDVLWIAGGTYHSSLSIKNSGTSASRLYLKRATANNPECTNAAGWNNGYDSRVIVSASPGNSAIVWTTANLGSYVTIDGQVENGIQAAVFDVNNENATFGGVDFVCGANYVEIKYVEAQGDGGATPKYWGSDIGCFVLTPGHGINPTSISHLLISHCTAHGAVEGFRITATTYLTVEYCKIYDISTANSVFHANMFYPSGGCNNGIFRYNQIWNYQSQGFYCADGPSHGWKVYGNVFKAGGNPNTGYVGAIQIDNRTGSPTNGLYIFNNVFTNIRLVFNLPGTINDLRVTNNIYYANYVVGYNAPNNLETTTDQFVNAAGNDYHLKSTSPARNAGADLGGEYSLDMDGHTRGADGTWDLGAYEYSAMGIYSLKQMEAVDWNDLPANPLSAGMLRKLAAPAKDLIVYDMQGNSIDLQTPVKNGIYFIQQNNVIVKISVVQY